MKQTIIACAAYAAVFLSGSSYAGVVTVGTSAPSSSVLSSAVGDIDSSIFDEDANANHARGQVFALGDAGAENNGFVITALTIQKSTDQTYVNDTLTLQIFQGTEAQWTTGTGHSSAVDGNDYLVDTGVTLLLAEAFMLNGAMANDEFVTLTLTTPIAIKDSSDVGFFFTYDQVDGTQDRFRYKEGGNGGRLSITTTAHDTSDRQFEYYLQGTAVNSPSLVSVDYGSPFQNGMVLQRGKPIKVWGDAVPANAVTVSINGETALTTSDEDGNWMVELPAMTAGGPYELMATGNGKTNTLTDVLVGDVWIAFGQSNMVRPLSEMDNNTDYIADISTNRMIRCLQVDQDAALTPQESGGMTWLDNSNPGSWGSVAAVFAHQMHEGSGVPTAVIWAGWGSSSIEGWMPIQMANDFPHFDEMMDLYQGIDEYRAGTPISSRVSGSYSSNLEAITAMVNGTGAWDDIFIRTRPNIIYNQRIHPLLNFGISGFVWYQGEANASTPENVAQYGFTLPAFVTKYRDLFGQGDLPFLGVQLPSYNSTYWAWFRESQSRVTALSNAFAAVTIDTGLANNIHPTDKESIGQRLALLGRKYALGEAIEAHGPTFASMNISGSDATIAFSHASGLTANNVMDPSEFELAGSDEVWHAATSSSISGTNVMISSSEETSPVAVRYAWSPAPVNEVNLVNSAGLPAAPFRTDDWAMPGLGAQAPMAVKDWYDASTNNTLVVPGAGILENDIDLNYDPLKASLVSDVAHGTLVLSADGSFSYRADVDYAGYDSFSYAASDGTLFGTATVTIAVNLGALAHGYTDMFDNDGLDVNLGKGGGLLTYIPQISKELYFSDDGNLTGETFADGARRGAVYSESAFSITHGFVLDVVYNIALINTTIADTGTFGLVDEIGNLDGLFIDESKGITGIGMSLTTRPASSVSRQGLNEFDADGIAFTNLSNAQIVTVGTNKTFNLTVLSDGSFSYSVDGAPSTTGGTTLDLTQDYHFAAYAQRNAGFAIQSVSLIPIQPVTEIGDISMEFQPGGAEMLFAWDSEVGATYVLESTEDLVEGPWAIVTNLLGTGNPISVTEDMDETNAFYRVFLAE